MRERERERERRECVCLNYDIENQTNYFANDVLIVGVQLLFQSSLRVSSEVQQAVKGFCVFEKVNINLFIPHHNRSQITLKV